MFSLEVFFDFFMDASDGIIGFEVQTELQQQRRPSHGPANRLDEKRLFLKSGQTVAEARTPGGQGTSTIIFFKETTTFNNNKKEIYIYIYIYIYI